MECAFSGLPVSASRKEEVDVTTADGFVRPPSMHTGHHLGRHSKLHGCMLMTAVLGMT